MLLAVDGSDCSEAAVHALVEQFRPEDTDVKVVHAVEWLKEMPLCFQFAQGANVGRDITQFCEQSFERARQLVERVAAQLAAKGFRTSTSCPDSDARHAIVDIATTWGADLIMMGSHGRHGFDRIVLGSVAEAIVRRAPCSVEVVRAQPFAQLKATSQP